MGGDRIMGSDHKNGSVTGNAVRTEQTNPAQQPGGEEPARKTLKPPGSPKDSR